MVLTLLESSTTPSQSKTSERYSLSKRITDPALEFPLLHVRRLPGCPLRRTRKTAPPCVPPSPARENGGSRCLPFPPKASSLAVKQNQPGPGVERHRRIPVSRHAETFAPYCPESANATYKADGHRDA